MVLFAAVSKLWIFALVGIALIKLIVDGERLFFVRDLILKQVYEQNRALWNQLGKPTGRIWRPPGEKSNIMRGTLYRPLWVAGSIIEEEPRVQEQFQKQMAISRQMTRIDLPLLCAGVLLAIFFSRT